MLQRCSRGDAGVRAVGMQVDGTGLKAAAVLLVGWVGRRGCAEDGRIRKANPPAFSIQPCFKGP